MPEGAVNKLHRIFAAWRVGFIGISAARASSVFSVCSRAAVAAITLPSATPGGAKRRRSASIRAPFAAPPRELPPPFDPRAMRSPPRVAPGAPRFDPGPRYDQPVSLDPPLPGAVPGAGAEPLDFRRPYGAPKPPPTRPPLSAPLD